MKQFVTVVAVVTVSILAIAMQQKPSERAEGKQAPRIPASLAAEHEELHAELVALTRVEGAVGLAARAVAGALHAHFEREEAFALPPLGLLVPLASGRIEPDMKSCLELTERLKADLPAMVDEHRQIVEHLDQLAAAAREAKNERAGRFARDLRLHAQTEEQVLYPAAIVVGELLKLKLKE